MRKNESTSGDGYCSSYGYYRASLVPLCVSYISELLTSWHLVASFGNPMVMSQNISLLFKAIVLHKHRSYWTHGTINKRFLTVCLKWTTLFRFVSKVHWIPWAYHVFERPIKTNESVFVPFRAENNPLKHLHDYF